jgi:Fic family protein
MRLNYIINNNIADRIFGYAKYSSSYSFLETTPYWKQRLIEIVENENASSAVSIDKKITNQWTFKPTLDRLSKIFPPEKIAEYKYYRIALESIPRLFKSNMPLDSQLVKEIHKICMGLDKHAEYRRGKRKFTKYMIEDNIEKTMQIEIQTSAGEIEKKLEDLLAWLNENLSILNPVILCGIFHIKFAEIHPFDDGNGRVIRIFEKGILNLRNEDCRFLMLEDYYLRNRETYYHFIDETIGKKNLTAWLDFYATGMEFAASQATKILYFLSGGTIDLENKKIIHLTDRETDLVEIFNEVGQASAAEIGKRIGITRQSANALIKGLLQKELLTTVGANTSVRYKLNHIESTDIMPVY